MYRIHILGSSNLESMLLLQSTISFELIKLFLTITKLSNDLHRIHI